jgi:aminomethyltransferase
MTDTAVAALRKTPLNARHRSLGARMVPFAGWDMPVEYTGIVEEHMAVRTRAGLFDVSHMGEFEVAGAGALRLIQHVSTNDASKLEVGQAQYSGLTTPEGTFVDDLLVYRLATNHYLLVVNAGNIEKDYRWIAENTPTGLDVAVVNASSRYALLAIQGPLSVEILQTLTGTNLADIPYYSFATGEVASVRATMSRTGYTGEDGFEIFVPPQSAERVWDAIVSTGRAKGLIPAGLGARDTLRLEAAMRLHGSDIDETTSVVEAGLGWIVGWTKPEFLGHEVLRRQKTEGVPRRLVGFEMIDRGIARHGYKVFSGSTDVGVVTSGTQTPFLKKAIGMAYVTTAHAKAGTELEIEVRDRRLKARVVPLPFYKRPRSA